MRALLLILLLSSAAFADHGAELVWRSGLPFAGLGFVLTEAGYASGWEEQAVVNGAFFTGFIGLSYQMAMVMSDTHDLELQDVAAYIVGGAAGTVLSWELHRLHWDCWWPGMHCGLTVRPWQ